MDIRHGRQGRQGRHALKPLYPRTRLTPTLREEEIGQANGSVSDGAAVAQVEAEEVVARRSDQATKKFTCQRSVSNEHDSRATRRNNTENKTAGCRGQMQAAMWECFESEETCLGDDGDCDCDASQR